ncbi:MAG: hypothetical protein LBC65_01615 [Oscillospiraceae bacterium]|nr:hypothetical protein [Oscillospiraceae bacterium]
MTTPQPDREIHDLFDRTLKHLFTLSLAMIIGAINGIFHTDYPLNSEVIFENTEEISDDLDKLISDIKIRINKRDRFIIEAEIDPNKPIALKIFREAFEDALRNKINDDGVIRFPFPDVCVIYFEPNSQTPDIVTIRIEAQDGRSFDYAVPSFKPTEHSLQELSDRNLDIFLPFCILKFRKRLEKCKPTLITLRSPKKCA